MNAFPVAPAPSTTKLRGGYYTPEPLARFLAEWVRPAGSRLLEPSCGDGAILRYLSTGRKATGIEIEPVEAHKARELCAGAEVIASDFFEWFDSGHWGAWDGVAGNPPFIRFGNWIGPSRDLALDVMRMVGMKPTKLTNAWVPFVVASALALRPGGRLGLVVPAELLQVNYAAELRGFLVDEFSELTAVTFRRLVFEGVLQEVVLLLGVKGPGPAQIRITEVDGMEDLPPPDDLTALPHAPALNHDTEKWTKYFLDPPEIGALRQVRSAQGMLRLGDIADVDVGVVTGRNQFFVLRPSSSTSYGIEKYTTPLVSKSAQLRGISFADADLAEIRAADGPCELLAVDEGIDTEADPALASYIAAGEAAEVNLGYKCSIRKKWWVVPSIWIPDAFLLRQIYDHPRIVANEAGATSTDTIHRVRVLNGVPPVKLAAASVNTVTFAFAEVMGRSYGGGVLELEPREAENLPFPDPHRLTMGDVADVDRLLRGGDLQAALNVVDNKVLEDLDAELIGRLRNVWQRLRDRRLARGRKKAGA